MILSLLKRRGWLIQKHLISTLSISFVLPIMLHLTLMLPVKAIFIRSIRHTPIELWLFPGILFIIATVALIPHLYRDFFDLRIHKKALMPMTLTPVSKFKLTLGILTTAVIESILFAMIGGAVLTVITGVVFPWLDYVVMLAYLCLFTYFIGCIIITISLLTEHVSIFILLIFSLFIFIVFGSGIIFEFEYYPVGLGYLLRYSPVGMTIYGLRMMIFSHLFDWISVIVPFLLISIWLPLNAEILRRKLHQ